MQRTRAVGVKEVERLTNLKLLLIGEFETLALACSCLTSSAALGAHFVIDGCASRSPKQQQKSSLRTSNQKGKLENSEHSVQTTGTILNRPNNRKQRIEVKRQTNVPEVAEKGRRVRENATFPKPKRPKCRMRWRCNDVHQPCKFGKSVVVAVGCAHYLLSRRRYSH